MKIGKVYLVGAGPGDYKLVTLKGLELVKKCDVVVYDRLSSPEILNNTKDGCEFIYVGKKSGNHTMKQYDINKLLVEKAKEGKEVVRLKGGDPYVFGRGGEEGEYLFNEGIDFEVVPGITSAIGGLCYGGIPITNRGYNTSFHIITGHLKDEKDELDFTNLAKLDGTLVFLMGMKNLERICEELIKNGKNIDTPVAIIHWATYPNQQVITGKLSNITEEVKKHKITSPSLIVVGEVVKLREKLNFQERKPLFGKNIIITRPETQEEGITNSILSLGGNPISIPSIEIKDIWPNSELMEAIDDITEYSYIVFTSVNGVKIFMKGLDYRSYDVRKLGNIKVVAIGSATADSLKERGIIADIIPKRYIAEDIYDELSSILDKNDRILIPRSKNARSYLVDELSNICEVKEIHTYYTESAKNNKDILLNTLNNQEIDYITFTSSSTVKGVIDLLGKDNIDLIKVINKVSIGPITSDTMNKYGLNVDLEAEKYNVEGIIKSILLEEDKSNEFNK
ncbi:uroporphyrinogen-III C-methyltransferase [Clostridium sp. D2Q-14]|uniref:uroporphyrinogen-III C-methyltransferase n=1 Tax=Anaeromonas gelatinilytica TaxID=2683194 RepID=UPI00193C0D1E|nr:uroporphyrinogen-III C-methyltransferase [Anaeromonas gelatinilytica]MBS4535477.1 uroporphyrinogen-III C-methyltransferase [Anaeromonas gelatinilytica]